VTDGTAPRPLHVSLVAVPETMISTLGGIYDVLNSFGPLAGAVDGLPHVAPFRAEIVTPAGSVVRTASGLPVEGRSLDEVRHTDIVVIPSLMPEHFEWAPGAHGEVVAWLKERHADGAVLCSVCTSALLLAETGLLEGRKATIHPRLVEVFRREFPAVDLEPERILVAAGAHEELVSSGSTSAWHDLVLYLIARFVGPTAAVEIARFFLLRAHEQGQAHYTVFVAPTDHDDALVRTAQEWLHAHFAAPNPVERVVVRAAVSERTFKRRFGAATGHSVMDYVQRLRVEAAKRRLEQGTDSVDEISAAVGYVDPAFFRKLFKRLTGVAPASYRQTLQLPPLARAEQGRLS